MVAAARDATRAVLVVLVVVAGAAAARGEARFGFEDVEREAKALAAAPHRPPAPIPPPLARLDYDSYRAVRFRPEETLWRGAPGFFRVQFFPVGFLYTAPVEISVVSPSGVTPVTIAGTAFDWGKLPEADRPRAEVPLAGFRILYPLHFPQRDDEIASFLGASYFRLLARGQRYGLSARGIAVDPGLPRQEEFPRFIRYWLVEPEAKAQAVQFYALLDTPGLSGAYAFTLRPGDETVLEVRATLFARHGITRLGIAPLTSMFFTGKGGDRRVRDYRPEVHDSDGLLIAQASGEWLWRPLSNPNALALSAFSTTNPRGFGLLQRERDFARYQDLEAQYHRRPSLWVEPSGDWGPGEVMLMEIPSSAEIHDNIAAYWVGREPLVPGRPLELAYRLRSVAGTGDPSPGARAVATRLADVLQPGGRLAANQRRFVVDFAGGALARLDPRQPVEADVAASGGRLVAQRIEPVEPNGQWRLVLDIELEARRTVELRAALRLYEDTLTETWTYALRPPAP